MTFSLGLVAHEGRKDELLTTFRTLLGSIRGSAGCLRCDLFEDVQQSNDLRLLVKWKDREVFRRHVKGDVFRRVLQGAELAAKPPQVEIRTITGERGMDFLREVLEYEDDPVPNGMEQGLAEGRPRGGTR